MMLPMLSIPHNPYIFTFFLILPCLTTEEIVGVQRMQRRHEREISDHAIIHYNMATYTPEIHGLVKKEAFKNLNCCARKHNAMRKSVLKTPQSIYALQRPRSI